MKEYFDYDLFKAKGLDKKPWYVNHYSPMAKWMFNFSMLGFCWFKKTGGLIWFFFFNPVMIELYLAAVIILGFSCFLG